jgi:dynein heavy chain
VLDYGKIPQLLKDYLEDYNMTTTNIMRLVFFKDAIDHISRIARILRQPRGNAMLVGVGGSGKQSLTRYACFLVEYRCFQIELTKGYGNAEFREDLKELYKIAGNLVYIWKELNFKQIYNFIFIFHNKLNNYT